MEVEADVDDPPAGNIPFQQEQVHPPVPPQAKKRKAPVQTTMPEYSRSRMSKQKEENIHRKLAKFITFDLRPFSLVEGEGFREYCHALNPDYKVPCRSTIVARCKLLHRESKSELKAELRGIDFIHTTSDGWQSRAGDSYMTETGHCINAAWLLISYTLFTVALPERHTAENIRLKLEEKNREWGIEGKIVGTTHDSAANMVRAIEDSILLGESVPCFDHRLHLVVMYILIKIPRAATVCQKGSSIVTHFKHSAVAQTALVKYQKSLDLPIHCLIQSFKVRWNSYQLMMERLVEQKEAIVAVLNDKNVTKKEAQKKLEMSLSDWDDMESFSALLKPFTTAITVISSENEVTISSTRPVVFNLIRSHLQPNEGDSQLISNMKVTMKKLLKQKFKMPKTEDERSDIMLSGPIELHPVPEKRPPPPEDPNAPPPPVNAAQLAALLDPRYKLLKHETREDKERIVSRLRELYREEVVANNQEDFSPTSNRPGQRTALDQLLGDADETQAADLTHNEFDLYLSEPQINHNQNPLVWWRNNAKRFPIIARLAKKYLCMQGSSTPSERVFSTCGNTVTVKRNALDPENVDMLVYLYQNRKFKN